MHKASLAPPVSLYFEPILFLQKGGPNVEP